MSICKVTRCMWFGAIALTLASAAAAQDTPTEPILTVTDQASGRAPNGPPLTDAQKLIAALPPPKPGALFPQPPMQPNASMPGADPRDFKGTWIHTQALELRIQKDIYGHMPPYTMEGATVLQRRALSRENGKPYLNASALCLPPGPLWQQDLNMPFSVFQSDKGLDIVFMEYHGRLRIAFDPKDAPAPTEKPYMGTSLAHWDGSALVVETSGFRDDLWLDTYGTPFSKTGKMVQRIRKFDPGAGTRPYLQIETTIVDTVNYTEPWTIVRKFSWEPVRVYFTEYNCEEQIGDPSITLDAGLPSEAREDAQAAKARKLGGSR